MKILLTGAGGQVGQAVIRHAKEQSHLHAYNRKQLCITDFVKLKDVFSETSFDLVINAAAYTHVDLAEKEISQAFNINEQGSKNLALLCNQFQIPLIHLSTDYVFSGEKKTPYTEDDAPSPLNIYGKSKLAGENIIQQLCPQHLIIRVSGVFSIYNVNFVKKMLELGQQKETLTIVDDQVLCPTSADDIAILLLHIANASPSAFGLYHYCSNEGVNWYEFAKTIFSEARQYQSFKLKELRPIPTQAYPTPAKRPAFSALDCNKIQNQFAVSQADWRKSVSLVIKELLT